MFVLEEDATAFHGRMAELQEIQARLGKPEQQPGDFERSRDIVHELQQVFGAALLRDHVRELRRAARSDSDRRFKS